MSEFPWEAETRKGGKKLLREHIDRIVDEREQQKERGRRLAADFERRVVKERIARAIEDREIRQSQELPRVIARLVRATPTIQKRTLP